MRIGRYIPQKSRVRVVKRDSRSGSKCTDPKESHFKPGSEFYETSYLDRFLILCQRLRRESVYGAVWFAVADPLNSKVEEPDPDLSYDRFIAEIRGKIGVFNSCADKI